MSTTSWKSGNWQSNKWEFYKNADGLWHWRAIVPEGWDHNKGDWKSEWKSAGAPWNPGVGAGKNWDWKQTGIWVETARSPRGWTSKTECEANAKENGWS